VNVKAEFRILSVTPFIRVMLDGCEICFLADSINSIATSRVFSTSSVSGQQNFQAKILITTRSTAKPEQQL